MLSSYPDIRYQLSLPSALLDGRGNVIITSACARAGELRSQTDVTFTFTFTSARFAPAACSAGAVCPASVDRISDMHNLDRTHWEVAAQLEPTLAMDTGEYA